MKTTKHFLLAFAVLAGCNFTSIAQSDFAPLDAEWHHSGYGSQVVYKSIATKDTVILGTSCRKIVQNIFVDPKHIEYAPMFKNSAPLYIYGNKDTTFIYNTYYNRFTPLYVFNVAAGDTVRLNPVQNLSPNFPRSRDTNQISLSFVVDSVKNVSYDGELLKTVFSRALIEKESSLGWVRNAWGSTEPVFNVYAEKIGSIYNGFLPNCINGCAGILADGYATPDTLLCYKDAVSNIHFIAGACDKDFTETSIKGISLKDKNLVLSPNPATSIVSVGSVSLNFEHSIIIYNALGVKIWSKDFAVGAPVSFDISMLSSGLYFVKLENKKTQEIAIGKLIKE